MDELVAENHLVLSGAVLRRPERRVSPAGIPIARFLLDHRSRQQEAGMTREVQCRIRVVASGVALQGFMQRLQTGSRVRVEGFLSRAGYRDPHHALELHAQHIELLEPQSEPHTR
jgi:primosomal replication protein N